MDNTFSKRLKDLRASLKLTQAEFAKEIGTTQATLSSYENSDKLPPVDVLISIGQKYHVSLDWLCGLQNEQIFLTVTTYSDIIRLLSALGTAENLKAGISIISVNDPNSFESHSEAKISIDDEIIVNFFEEWMEVLALCKKSPSGKKLYDVWIKDILEQYNNPIRINPTERNTDEDLPFE